MIIESECGDTIYLKCMIVGPNHIHDDALRAFNVARHT